MSVETTHDERATELAEELGETIAEMPAYQAFLDAKAAVEADEELQADIREFEELREEFLIAREAGTASNDDFRELQQAQQELHQQPKMNEYRKAQSELELTLQELDHIISDPLEVEFGQKAGGCCED